MANLDLFAWWAISISGGIVFLTIVSIYLYIVSIRARQKEHRRKRTGGYSIEFLAYVILTAISVVMTSLQTVWWLLPGLIFLLLSILEVIEDQLGRAHGAPMRLGAGSIVKNFIFVWVLLGLLVFYIITIQLGSVLLFAVGNICVEVLLIIYLRRNKTEETERA